MSRRPPSRGGRQREEPQWPKPFGFVPFTGKVDRGDAPGHERFLLAQHYSGRLIYDLVALKPVHVSSGIYALSEDLKQPAGDVLRDHYRVTRPNGERRPAVPGSSLKGATRAVVEAVTHSCVVLTRVERRQLPREARACRPEALCPACALFGAQSRLGRVSFSDAVVRKFKMAIQRVPALYGPRPWQSRRTYLDRQGNFIGRKFYFHGKPFDDPAGQRVETIAPESELGGYVDFHNLSGAELGVLFFALGLDGSLRLMVGGGKPVCLGMVEFRPRGLALVTAVSLTEYDAADEPLAGEALTRFIAERLKEAERLIAPEARDKLREILAPENTRDAPRGAY